MASWVKKQAKQEVEIFRQALASPQGKGTVGHAPPHPRLRSQLRHSK